MLPAEMGELTRGGGSGREVERGCSTHTVGFALRLRQAREMSRGWGTQEAGPERNLRAARNVTSSGHRRYGNMRDHPGHKDREATQTKDRAGTAAHREVRERREDCTVSSPRESLPPAGGGGGEAPGVWPGPLSSQEGWARGLAAGIGSEEGMDALGKSSFSGAGRALPGGRWFREGWRNETRRGETFSRSLLQRAAKKWGCNLQGKGSKRSGLCVCLPFKKLRWPGRCGPGVSIDP